MKRLVLVLLVAVTTPVFAAGELPGDAQAYVDRRKGCNYWLTERASKKLQPVRHAEIEHHLRELNCPALDHEEAVLNARYKGEPDLLAAIADAHDAMPD